MLWHSNTLTVWCTRMVKYFSFSFCSFMTLRQLINASFCIKDRISCVYCWQYSVDLVKKKWRNPGKYSPKAWLTSFFGSMFNMGSLVSCSKFFGVQDRPVLCSVCLSCSVPWLCSPLVEGRLQPLPAAASLPEPFSPKDHTHSSMWLLL